MATIITNRANATYNFEGSTEPRTTQSNITNTIVVDEYGLEVSKQSLQQTFVPGENITYAVRITNIGSQSLTSITVSDNLGKMDDVAPISYMQYSGRVSINGDFISVTPTSLDPLVFSIPGTLAYGDSITLTYVTTVSSSLGNDITEINNTATVNARSVLNPARAPITAVSNSATITRESSASLSIIKTANKSSIFSSDSLEYILTISNRGLVEATNVVITDQLPTGFTVSNIRLENEDFVHDYAPSEYTLDGNLLTLPNETGTSINVKAYQPDVDNSAIVRIFGTFTQTE